MYTNAQVALLAAAAQDTKEERIITRAEVFLVWLNKQSQAAVAEFAASQGIKLTPEEAFIADEDVEEEPTHYLTRDDRGDYICGGCRFNPKRQGLAVGMPSAIHAVRRHVSQMGVEDQILHELLTAEDTDHPYCKCGFNIRPTFTEKGMREYDRDDEVRRVHAHLRRKAREGEESVVPAPQALRFQGSDRPRGLHPDIRQE